MRLYPQFDTVTLQMYEYIRDYLLAYRLSPSIKEVADHCYLAQSTASYKLAKLEAKGWIVREIGVPRSMRLGENAPDYVPDPS